MNQDYEVLHWDAFRGCREDERLQTGSDSRLQLSRKAIVRIVRAAGYTVFGSNAHRYSSNPKDGFTVTIIIGQSAMIFHTYPEKDLVTSCCVTCPEEEKEDTQTHNRLLKLLKKYFNAHYVDEAVTAKMNLNVA